LVKNNIKFEIFKFTLYIKEGGNTIWQGKRRDSGRLWIAKEVWERDWTVDAEESNTCLDGAYRKINWVRIKNRYLQGIIDFISWNLIVFLIN